VDGERISVSASTEVDQPIEGGSSRPTAHANIALAVIAAAQLMVVLDATIVNIALPHIHTALKFSPTGLSWVLNAYTLVFGGLLLLGGRTGDLFGRRRMFIVGVSLFAAASLAGGFAQDKGFLLAMRALQGVGGAIASPTALSLVTTTFPQGPERNRAFGVYAAVSGAGAALGLILGGVLTDLLSWRWVLFVNAPIGLGLALAAPYVIAETERRKAGPLDVAGAIASTGGMAALVYGFIHAATYSWGSTTTLVSFAAAVVFLSSFIVIESRAASPIMPLRLFRNSARVGSYLVMLIMGAGVFAMFYFLTQYVQMVKDFSPLRAGFAFLPISAVIIVMAQIASRIVAKIGPQILIMTGTIVAGFGLFFLSTLTPDSSYPLHILPAICLIGAGMGFIFVPITLTAVAGVATADSGIASAMLNVGQQVGGTLGLSALVTVFSTAARHDAKSQAGILHGVALQHHVFTHGADMAFRAGAIFALFGLVAAAVLIKVQVGESPSAVQEVPAP
jgi:EmrB/QacA subfamily drug resistance transporter